MRKFKSKTSQKLLTLSKETLLVLGGEEDVGEVRVGKFTQPHTCLATCTCPPPI